MGRYCAALTILRALPVQRWTWDQVAQAGEEIEETYWRRARVFWMSEDGHDVAFAIRKLISVGRARHALPLAGRGAKVHLPTDLLVEVLREAARQPFEGDGDMNEATMFQHYIAETLQLLDERNDVEMDALVALEWTYLPVLEHSRRPPAKVLPRALGTPAAGIHPDAAAPCSSRAKKAASSTSSAGEPRARPARRRQSRPTGYWISGTASLGPVMTAQ